MRLIFILTLSLNFYLCCCSRKSKPLGPSRVAFLPDGNGYIAKQPYGNGACIDYYDILEIGANYKTKLYRIDLSGCHGHGGIGFTFNIQNDSVFLFHSEEKIQEDETKVVKIGNGKYPVIIKYSYFEVAGIPEDADILVLESKWDSVLAEAKARSKKAH